MSWENFSSLAQREQLLLSLYGKDKLPKQTRLPAGTRRGTVDRHAKDLIEEYGRERLPFLEPLKVTGDGNCLFNALSRAIYASEGHNLHIRLLVALEVALNPQR